MKFLSITLFIIFIAVAGLTVMAPMMPSIMSKKEQAPLVIGVFPRRHQSVTVEIFNPLAHYLSKELGRRVYLISSPNFKKFWAGVKQRKYDIVHFNQYHYLRSKNNGYEVFAMNEEQGRSTITGSVIVRKDSGINSVQDLKGKRILFGGGPKAMQSFIYATYLLRQGGLRDGDYEVRFANNPPSAIVNTYFKLYDVAAAGAGDIVLDLPIVGKQIDTSQLKILTKGERFAHLPWAYKSELPTELKIKIQKVFLSLKKSQEGRKVLKKARLTNIVRAVDTDFDPHRRIVREVLGEIY